MLCRTVGAFAALALGANAFLLPPGVNSASSSDIAIDPQSQAIKIPCPGCVFPAKEAKATETEEGDGLFWAQGSANDVIFNFTITDDKKTLNLNGWQVYPVTMEQGRPPTLDQVSATASLADAKEHPEQKTALEISGASIMVDEEHVSPTGDKIVRIVYQVMSVEGQPMHLDGAEVKLLEGSDGSLMIIAVEVAPREHEHLKLVPLPSPMEGHEGQGMRPHKECGMLPAMLCKWKGMVESKIDGFKQGMPHKVGGCGGPKGGRPHRLPGHIKTHIENADKPDGERPGREGHPPMHHGGPPRPHHGPHHGHHRHHRHFLHRILRAFVVVLVPVMAGISMGIFVSLTGMLVGRLIAFLWIKFRRGGQRGYASVAQAESEDENVDMEKGDVEVVAVEEDVLPIYEAAPAYEEKEQK
ncbi:hypothetical protein MBLNU459_g2161t1 [Dothideomycetes sp. NU459]